MLTINCRFIREVPGGYSAVVAATLICLEDFGSHHFRPASLCSTMVSHLSEQLLLTGATGYVGVEVLAQLLKAGYKTFAAFTATREESRNPGRRYRHEIADKRRATDVGCRVTQATPK